MAPARALHCRLRHVLSPSQSSGSSIEVCLSVLGKYCVAQSGKTPQLFQLVCELLVCRLCGCDYEMVQTRNLPQTVGLAEWSRGIFATGRSRAVGRRRK